jgi:hypothetical protein
MCQTDSFGFARCACPITCPVSSQTVCTVYGLHFTSKCEMHRFSCANSVRISTKNKGECLKEGMQNIQAKPDPRLKPRLPLSVIQKESRPTVILSLERLINGSIVHARNV